MSINDDTLIENYLLGKLSGEERSLFEQRLENDPEFNKKFRFEKQLFETLDPEDWSFSEADSSDEISAYKKLFASEKTKIIKKAIGEANTQYKRDRKINRRNWLLYSSAAIIAILISVFTWYDSGPSMEQLYSDNLDLEDLPSLVTRGEDNPEDLIRAQQLFEGRQYLKTIEILNTSLKSSKKNLAAKYQYLGISQMELNYTDDAENTFTLLIESNLIDAQKGHWYKALLYLKMKDSEKAIKTLQKIRSEKLYNYKKANKILKELI